MIIGIPSLVINALNERPEAAPIIIFGGSPMSVAAPQMLLAIMMGMRRASGFILRILVI